MFRMPQFKTGGTCSHIICKTSPGFTFNFKANTGWHSRVLNIIQLAINSVSIQHVKVWNSFHMLHLATNRLFYPNFLSVGVSEAFLNRNLPKKYRNHVLPFSDIISLKTKFSTLK